MKKRVLFAVLSLLLMLALFPVPQAQAANPLSELHIGGVSVGGVSGGAITLPTTQGYYTYGTDTAQTASNQAALPAASAYTWALQKGADGYFLTLNGISNWGEYLDSATGYSCGIYARGDLSILLKESNGIANSSSITASESSCGLYVSGSLSITGDSTADLISSGTIGIHCQGLAISSGKVYATGSAIGVENTGGEPILISGGSIYPIFRSHTATRTEAYGIYSDGPITVSGGTIYSMDRNALLNVNTANPVCCTGVYARPSITVTGTGSISVRCGLISNQNHTARHQSRCIDTITFTVGGQAHVFADGSQVLDCNASSESTGIYCRTLNVSGTPTVSGSGGASAGSSYGIFLFSGSTQDTRGTANITGGYVCGVGEVAVNQSCGLYAAGGSVSFYGDSSTSSASLNLDYSFGGRTAAHSYGIICSDLTVLGGRFDFFGHTKAITTTGTPGIRFSNINHTDPNWYEWFATTVLADDYTFTPAATAQFNNGIASYIDVGFRPTSAAPSDPGTTPIPPSVTPISPTPTPGLADADIPKTGDGSTPGVWLAAMTAALAGLLTIAVLRRRQKRSAR